MMLRAAAWVIDQEIKLAKRAGISVSKDNKLEVMLAVGLIQLPYLTALSMTPYYQLAQAHGRMSWAVKDIAWSRQVAKTGAFGGRFNTYTFFNYAPRTLAFGTRGGMRLLALKAGARLIPYAGFALLAYDLWSVGKWIGEKTSPV